MGKRGSELSSIIFAILSLHFHSHFCFSLSSCLYLNLHCSDHEEIHQVWLVIAASHRQLFFLMITFALPSIPSTMAHARKYSHGPSDMARKGSVNENTPWFLQLDHADQVVRDPDTLTVKQGTLTGLVEHLTRHDKLDVSFNDAFLLTYPSFVSAGELLEKLLARFYVLPSDGMTAAETQRWVEQKQQTIRFRVVNILKNWFGRFWLEPQNDNTVSFVRQTHHVVQSSPAIMETPGAPQLLVVIEQRLQDKSTKHLVPPPIASAPPPLVPKNLRKIKVLDIDATEFARQLTIAEYRHYARIKPKECLNKSWQKKDPKDPGTNVNSMILHSNQLAGWVSGTILAQTEIKKRVMLIKHFINIADVRFLVFARF